MERPSNGKRQKLGKTIDHEDLSSSRHILACPTPFSALHFY